MSVSHAVERCEGIKRGLLERRTLETCRTSKLESCRNEFSRYRPYSPAFVLSSFGELVKRASRRIELRRRS